MLDSLTQPVDDNHFVAVKIGDVNGSAKTDIIGANAEPRNNDALIFKSEDKPVEAGELVYVPVTSDDYRGVMGYQFTLELNHATFEGLLPGALAISESQIGRINSRKVTFSYDDAFGSTLGSDQILFTLVFKVQKNANLSEIINVTSDITSAEAYYEGLSVVSPLRLTWEKAPLISEDIILHQNEPNPFVSSTSVGFVIPQDGRVTLNIFNMQGKLIHSRRIDAKRGLNTEVFTAEQIGSAGLYYYELSAFNKTLGRKMIRIE